MTPFVRQLPNALGIGRLCTAPAIVWLLARGEQEWAFWVFLVAGLSDAVDGAAARRLGVVTRFGAALDPVADKTLIAAGFLAAAAASLLPWWLALLAVGRDATIVLVAGVTWLLRPALVPLPLAIGKLTTGVQIATIAAALAEAAYGFLPPQTLPGFYALTALMTLASGVAYAAQWSRKIAAARNAPSGDRPPTG